MACQRHHTCWSIPVGRPEAARYTAHHKLKREAYETGLLQEQEALDRDRKSRETLPFNEVQFLSFHDVVAPQSPRVQL
jgi:hypothetical protein